MKMKFAIGRKPQVVPHSYHIGSFRQIAKKGQNGNMKRESLTVRGTRLQFTTFVMSNIYINVIMLYSYRTYVHARHCPSLPDTRRVEETHTYSALK